MNVIIRNVKTYATEYKYIVARRVDNEWWFWGAWNEYNEAFDAATNINGCVFPREEVQCEVCK